MAWQSTVNTSQSEEDVPDQTENMDMVIEIRDKKDSEANCV